MMWGRLMLVGGLGLLVALYQASVVSFLPPWLQARPFLPFVVLLLVSSSRSRAFVAAMAGACILDAYTLDYFSLALLRLPLIVFILDVIASRLLTNRSVYATAALVVLARAMDWFTAWLLALMAIFLNLHDGVWLMPQAPGFVLLWDVLLSAIGFFLVASLTGRFHTRAGNAYGPR